MDRRQFHIALTGSVSSSLLPASQRAGSPLTTTAPNNPEWPAGAWRRLLVDMHISDSDPAFLARFDPDSYVETVAKAGFQALTQYANSCAGYCLYPTKAGEMHSNLKGRDIFREVLAHCRRHRLRTLGYFVVIYDGWAFAKHPDWRMEWEDGASQLLRQRNGYACPNTAYRDYVKTCLREIAAYDLDGLFIDMTFWPQVCYCPACVKRYRAETNADPPRSVDWHNPEWRRLQTIRERWMIEFATELTAAAKSVRPAITVTHQYSTVFNGWMVAQPAELTEACDYLSGDFYGGAAEYSLACKTFRSLSRRQPFEFLTSRTRRLNDHVTTKTLEEMVVTAHIATIHSGAFSVIDAINPDGTVEPDIYRLLGKLNAESAAYETFLGGDLTADVAIYFDKHSLYDPGTAPVSPAQLNVWGLKYPHRDAVVGAARILKENQIPFGVVTNANLGQLRQYRAVILPDVLEMTAAQSSVFRDFVAGGGVLVATGRTSIARRGESDAAFLLGDVLGLRYRGLVGTKITYLSLADKDLLQELWPQKLIIHYGPMVEAEIDVEPQTAVRTLATVTLPWIAPEAGNALNWQYAAIHSDPPSPYPGNRPGCTIHRFGKGTAIWLAAPFEASVESATAKLLTYLIRSALPSPPLVEAITHPSVEITVFHQQPERRLLVSLLTTQSQLPSLPVQASLRVRLPEGKRSRQVLAIPSRKSVPFEQHGQVAAFRSEPFQPLAMFLVLYE